MKEALKTVLENLTDKQKAVAQGCKDLDELFAYLGKEGIELPDDIVDEVAGGGWITLIPPEVEEQLKAFKTVTGK